MKILFLVPYVPTLIRVRPYNLIRTLASRGHHITLLTLWTDEAERAAIRDLEPYCQKIYAYPLPNWRSLYNCGRALPTSTPLQAVYCWQPELAATLRDLILESAPDDRFDVIHIEHLRGAKFGVELLSEGQKHPQTQENLWPPIVWDSVDSISHLFRQASSSSKMGFSRLITGFDLPRTEKYEGWLTGQFNEVLVTSHVDKEAFQSLIPSDGNQEPVITVLPNGVDLGYFKPDETVSREAATLVVSGKMSYHANINMVLYLVNEIMPLIWERRPDVKLWIVGKDPSNEILALAKNPAISVTGFVESVLPYLHKASIAVSPILYGAGIQNKVLEAMACGTPVVATPQAISAITAKPDENILVGETPEAFAQATLELLDNEIFRSKIGNAGRLFVEQNHDWNKIGEDLENIYTKVKQQKFQPQLS
ncbi:MAG TPA: glycosyl transferase family 1 [Chloroflexi bacterium]|nr:glycosyl transferase family 1 [Chloroflexota bacterium]HBY09202.1 glycosyl transferase family 1 [Chloroflexota bacterium]